ncbi:hypothetical protein L0244_30915 [bacterium]|nr:hypothetical protein [bacterium]
MKTKIILALFATFIFTFSGLCSAAKFYPDDPIMEIKDTQDASGVESWDINLFFDLTYNLFTHPGDPTPNVRAQSINTIDEVPDSSWFTNRNGLTPQMVAKAVDTSAGPAEGKWTIIASKNDGISPGFTIKDSAGTVWFIKFDAIGFRTMSTGTEVAVSKLFWALGFNVPEYHIARLDPANLEIAEGTKIRLPGGRKRDMNAGDIRRMLKLVQKDPDGSYRIIASKALEGKILGGFKLDGTRPDDPNDVILHEHRRELRGYLVFAAWLNHVDIKALQSMDTLLKKDGKSYVKHHLLDFSSALGSGSIHAHEPWEGYENLFEGGGYIAGDIPTLGFRVEHWRTVDNYKSHAVGIMPKNNDEWNPEEWKPRASNGAFYRARPDDKFWAARKIMGISDDLIRAAIETGQFDDPESIVFLTNALIQRRNSIARIYLPAVNPIVDPQLSNDLILKFGNAAVDAAVAKAPANYTVIWNRFNNATGESTRIASSGNSSTQMKAPTAVPADEGTYLKLEMSAQDPTYPSWNQPVFAYFHKTGGSWKLVGFERMPEGNPPMSMTAEEAKKAGKK